MHPHSRAYELSLVAILCFAFGLVNFEMFSISYLMPFIQPKLSLSNTEIGFLLAGYWTTFALSSYLTGWLADRVGRHKSLLLHGLLVFSVSSVLSGFAGSFVTLLLARLLAGLV